MALARALRTALNTKAKYFVLWGSATFVFWISSLGMYAWTIRDVARLGMISVETERLQTLLRWPIAVGLTVSFAASAFEFLRRVHRVRRFLADRGDLEFASWSVTVVAFAIPFVNFFVPWNRLDVIRESLRRYLTSGQLSVAQNPESKARMLGIVWGVSSLITVSGPADDVVVMKVLLFGYTVQLALALLSFILAVRWLAGLVSDFEEATGPQTSLAPD